MRKRPAATRERGPRASTTSRDGEQAGERRPPCRAPTARVAPIRSETRPASGRPVTEPTLAASRVSPSSPGGEPEGRLGVGDPRRPRREDQPGQGEGHEDRRAGTRSPARAGVDEASRWSWRAWRTTQVLLGRGRRRDAVRLAAGRIDSIESIRYCVRHGPPLVKPARRAGRPCATSRAAPGCRRPRHPSSSAARDRSPTATAERVRAAAGDLAYAGPDPLASSLRQGRVGTVAVVVEGPLRYAFHDPFALAVLDGLAEELDAAGRSMLLVAQPRRGPRARGRPARDPGRRRRGLPAVRRPRQPRRRPPAARGVPLVGSGAPVHPGWPTCSPTRRRPCGSRPATCSTSATPGSPTCRCRSAPASATGWVTERGRRPVPPTRMPRGGSRGSARSPATTPRSCRRTTSPSRPGRPRPGSSSTSPASEPAHRRRRPGRPARGRRGPRRGVAGPAGARGPHASPASTASSCRGSTTCSRPSSSRARRRAGDGAARPPGPRGPPGRRRAVPGAAEGGDDLVAPTLGVSVSQAGRGPDVRPASTPSGSVLGRARRRPRRPARPRRRRPAPWRSRRLDRRARASSASELRVVTGSGCGTSSSRSIVARRCR